MDLHRNAKLGLSGRPRARERDRGWPVLEGGCGRLSCLAGNGAPLVASLAGRSPRLPALADRSSRPLRQPHRLSASEEEPILRARRETNLGPGRLAGIVGRARSTIWKVLHRHGLSRRPRGQRQQSYRRYSGHVRGALLHMDVKKLARFSVPGHRVTGDRSTKDLHRGIGYDHLHCVVDDHSRIAYVELHPREDADTNVRTLERALAFFAELGLEPPEAVMTDNALVDPAQSGLPGAARRRRAPPHPHACLHAALEWQGRALHPDAAERMGLQPQLAQLEHPCPQPAKLHPLLQPQTPAQLTRRPTSDQPRSQRLWAGQLAPRAPAARHRPAPLNGGTGRR